MAAAAGRSLLLLLCSRGGGGGGAGGCGALTAGCFPGLGVSRHRQHQQHRTVSERGSGRAGRLGEPRAGRGARRLPSTRGRPGVAGHRAAVSFSACGGGREGRAGGRRESRGGGGATAGMFPQDWGRRGGEDAGLEPLPDPPPGSVPPSAVPSAFLQGSRTEPSASCPLLSSSGLLGRPELPRFPVSGEWQCHAAGNCPRRAPRDPRKLLPRPLWPPRKAQEGKSNFIPL